MGIHGNGPPTLRTIGRQARAGRRADQNRQAADLGKTLIPLAKIPIYSRGSTGNISHVGYKDKTITPLER